MGWGGASSGVDAKLMCKQEAEAPGVPLYLALLSLDNLGNSHVGVNLTILNLH